VLIHAALHAAPDETRVNMPKGLTDTRPLHCAFH